MNRKASLAVIFVTIFLDLVGFGIIIPILPDLAVSLGGDAKSLAVAALYPLMNWLFAPLWGTLSDRHGRRPIILISIFVTAMANFFFGFVTAIWMLVIQRALAGIGSANISAANAYIADISEPENRAKNMGLIGAAFGLGFIFGPAIGGYFKTQFGLMGVGLISGGFSFFNLIMAFFMLPESLKEKNKDKEFSLNPIKPLIGAFKTRIFRDLFLLSFIFIMAFSLMQVTAALLWKEHFGLTEEKHIGYVFSFIGLSSAIVQGLLVGPMNKRFGEKKLLIIGFVLMIIGLTSMPYAPDIWWELLPLAIIALANGMINPSILSLLSATAARNVQGQILGLNQSVGSLGRVAGPVMGGFLYTQGYQWPYIIGGCLLVLALFFTFDIYRKKVLT